MNKQNPYLLAFFLFFFFSATSQDTLSLMIPERTAGILLKFNNTVIKEEGSAITAQGAAFIFKIASRKQGYTVSIINTEGNDSLRITDLNRSYMIVNNTLRGTANLTLKSNINLKIYNQLDELIKTYTIAYKTRETGTVDDVPVTGRSNAAANYRPGAAVIDALFLADPNNQPAIKYQILGYYAKNQTDAEMIRKMYEGNKFLDTLAQNVTKINQGQSASFFSTVFSSVGGLDVTNVADALARFLVKRTKQELSAVFFDRFKSTLDSIADLQTLFPSTANLLGSMGNEVYNYERYLQNLRESFIQDISGLQRNLPGIVDNHPAFFLRHQELKAALLSGCYVAGELENQAHPGDVLANYPLQYLEPASDGAPSSLQTYKAAIQTVQLISQSLRDTSSGDNARYWVNIRKVRELVNNRLALKYYLGLLLQDATYKFDSIRFERTATFIQQLNKVADMYDKGSTIYNAYKVYVLRFGEKADALNKMIAEYKHQNPDSSAMEKYQKYFRASVDMIQYCTAISELPVLNDIPSVQNLSATLKPYFRIAYGTADMVIEINKRNYSAAINHAVFLYNEVKAKPAKTDIASGLNNTTPVANAGNENARSSNFQKTLNLLIRYGGFMSVVASAKTSEEAEEAIEVFALPPGSSRIKRETIFNVSLNAYAGLYTGYEKIKGVDQLFKLNSYGVTAPLGIAISKGHSVFFIPSINGSSSSIFMSFVDIGAITAFRFTNDAAEKIPTVQLKHIISPGIFYSFGFGKTPLSANIGYQAGPLLRKVNLNENAYEKKYSRFSISLCVDIPVINFYTKSE
jgi:hypothetical protein